MRMDPGIPSQHQPKPRELILHPLKNVPCTDHGQGSFPLGFRVGQDADTHPCINWEELAPSPLSPPPPFWLSNEEAMTKFPLAAQLCAVSVGASSKLGHMSSTPWIREWLSD